MNIKTLIKKILAYCLGLFIVALGVSIAKITCLGVSPVSSIPAVASTILGIDMGICTAVVFTLFIVIQLAIMRKEFKMFSLLQMIPSFLFGFFVSATTFLCEQFLPALPNYGIAMVYLLISIVLVALGLLFYLNAEILPLPSEGVMQATAYKAHIEVSTAKIIFDWSVILVATILSLVFLGELDGIREGTIIAAFGVGLCLKVLERLFETPLRAFIYGNENNVETSCKQD